MKALVTGATGFIGSHLADRLASDRWDVRCLVRKTSRTDPLKRLGVELAEGDVRDAESLRAAARGREVMFHVAALVGEWGKPKDFFDINVQGMRNALEAASAAGVERFVDVSSTSVHGFEGFNRSTEAEPYRRSGVLYADTKRMAEEILWEYHRAERVRATTIRPCMVWGPRDPAYMTKIIPLLQKKKAAIVGDGRQNAGLAHARNVVDALVRAATMEAAAGEAFIVTDDCGTTVRQMIDALAEKIGEPAPKISIPFPVAKIFGNVSETIYRALGASKPPMVTRMGVGCIGNNLSFDISKIKKVLGYKPLLQFPDGLDEYIAWYRETHKDA